MRKKAFMAAMHYIPTRQVDVQAVMKDLTIRYVPPTMEAGIDEDFKEEQQVDPDNFEIQCFDISKPGYIGVPRQYGLTNFGHIPFLDITVKVKKRPSIFPRKIKARDDKQAEFMREIQMCLRGPSPIDIVANARTGTGKTVTALWAIENAIQGNTLVTVPTVYLLNQWRARIRQLMGERWFKEHVGHLQQGTMQLNTITLGVAASVARRDYPTWVKRHFAAVIIDEFHRIPTPTMSSILAKYPASIRIGLTATNRQDAFAKVAKLHMGKPRVVSRQEVMRPQVFIKEFTKRLHPRLQVYSERHMISILSNLRERNHMLAKLMYAGWERGRIIVGLSDRTDQLVHLRNLLVAEMPNHKVGIIAGSYRDDTGVVKPKQADKDRVASDCDIILATYGIFDTGADIDRLDMGVELTPRVNLRQAIGRVLRIRPGKPTPEWYSISDRIIVTHQGGAELFADPNGHVYQPLIQNAEARLASFRFQNGTVNILKD